ncbi:MAG TPA: transposase [Patescibacteria group bacterium]|nr:transposase [Patescibacteria group bacterium]
MQNENKNRKSIRLKEYDYSEPGDYFVTICTQNRECLFGEIVDGKMILNEMGLIVNDCWNDLENHYPGIYLDIFTIMPNHIHFILTILCDDHIVGAGLKPAPTGKRYQLFEIIRGFKTFSARKINKMKNTSGNPVWQRNYYEHIVRNEQSYDEIYSYIESNSQTWDRDRNNPKNMI